MKDTRGSVQ